LPEPIACHRRPERNIQVIPGLEEEHNMSWNLVVFALIGLFAGAAARLFYPNRAPMKSLGTVVLGMTGATLGGMLSWSIWQGVEGNIHFGALLFSLVGAILALLIWPGVTYARSISGKS